MAKNGKSEDVEEKSGYDSIEDAKAQAAEFFGFPTGEDIRIKLEDGTVEVFTVPFPGTLSDAQQERWNQLQFDIDQCDRYPDVVVPDHKLTRTEKVGERTITEGEKVTTETDVVIEDETFVPGQTMQGQLIQPYRKTQPDGSVKLMEPPYNARVAIALWGEERYAVFKANGGESRLINLLQQKMQRELEERQKADTKSAGSTGGVDEVSEADSDKSS